MYDNEDEIKRKRRNLLIIIGIVVLLIILLLIFLATRKTKKPIQDDSNKSISCVLEVKNGVTPNANNIYTKEIEVGFKEIVPIKTNDTAYEIQKKTVGTTDNSRNTETYKITKSGVYQLHGYVQDKAGNKATCDLSVTVNLSQPTCELEVKTGTLGSNNWYISDVEVGFKSMNTNSDTANIVKYYIEKELTDLDTTKTIKRDPPADNIDKVTITENQTIGLIGYVIDSNGTEGVCRLTVNKDATKPTCTLKVASGTKNANGEYTDEPVIELDEVKDDVTGIAKKGIGIAENYENNNYTVKNEGSTVVYGYVEDTAGNKGTCSVEIKRPKTVTPKPDPTPTPTKPTCSLTISGTKQDNNYIGTVTVTMKTSNATSYGINEGSKAINSKKTLSTSQLGTHKIYGYVKDKSGNEGSCTVQFDIVQKKQVVPDTKPTCQLSITADKKNIIKDGSEYMGSVTVTLSYTPSLASYGMTTNSSTATYNSKNKVTLSKAGTYTVYGFVKNSAGSVTCKKTIKIVAGKYLADVVKVGDYVNYNPGNWSNTVSCNMTTPSSKCTTDGYSWGYKKGTSKSIGVKCSTSDVSTADGWIVLSVSSGSSGKKTVTLVHAGTPECLYHSNAKTSDTIIEKMKTRVKENYMNDMAKSSSVLSCDSPGMGGCTSSSQVPSIFQTTSTHYYLGTKKDASTLWGVSAKYKTFSGFSNKSQGIRPVIVLKETVLVNQSATGGSGNGSKSSPWQITLAK